MSTLAEAVKRIDALVMVSPSSAHGAAGNRQLVRVHTFLDGDDSWIEVCTAKGRVALDLPCEVDLVVDWLEGVLMLRDDS